MTVNKRVAVQLRKSHAAFAKLANKTVGGRVAERRAQTELTQTDLGMPLGVTMQQAQRYEAGVTPMDVPTLITVARTLGCKPSDLLVDFEAGDEAPPALSRDAVAVARAFDTIPHDVVRAAMKTYVEKVSEAMVIVGAEGGS